ncbi:hypothetical protein KY290_006550 [Solanum tuberosum]|uniref:START domain-containing protein n=1 Tax=Solanum tuberosum TaxID=4113 RepID=A0ABQ7WHE4_SOLTU|nr:hypothetical protein KY289_006883 [Solanum tuberosum]KAH0753226.1 hypothetical protein KY285_006374 [Solanum tuberosum]KAH0780123.1 hypothetical protein KY290_006550 [Solanum tuberosum]
MTQKKTQNDISDTTSTFQKENERFRCEIMAMKEAMKNNMCLERDGPLIGEEERARNLEILKMKTQRLRDERTRLSNIISCFGGKSSVMDSNLAPPKSTFGSATNPLENGENSVISEIVVPAMNEMLGLLNVDDPIWVKSPTDERWFIHRESYDRTFPKPNRPYKSSTARIESSKDCGVVSMTAIELIQNFLDPISWMNMFPTIVTNARILEVLDSGNMGGSIQLVTWIEHVQVDEKYQVDRIFRDLLLDCQIYGAKRWIVTLQRMSERYNYARGATCPTRHDLKGVINDMSEEMKSVWQLSQRMVKSFCQVLSMTNKLNFTALSQLNSGDRVSIRQNEEITQPNSFIVTAATSQRLPLPFETIFDFLKDNKTRCQRSDVGCFDRWKYDD